MRIALLTLCFIASVTATAQARLGETADQLVQRYGQPLSENDQKGGGDKIASADVVFQKGGFQINVTLVDGISVAETFNKINGEALTIGEARTLLDDNSQGHEWEAPQVVQGGKLWLRDDSATASLGQDGSLTIKSKELMAKETTAKKLEARPSLDGF
jgi:hypothetical protein